MEKSTRTIWLVLSILTLCFQSVFAITDFKINGDKEITIQNINYQAIFTANLSAPGVRIRYYMYEDFNGNGILDETDPISFDGYLQDGIGWIGLLHHPLQAIIGDENGRDGTLKITLTVTKDLINRLPNGTLFFKFVDEDKTIDTAVVHLDCQVEGTRITGRVTDPDGNGLSGIAIDFGCSREDGYYWYAGFTNPEGYYTAVLPFADTWSLRAFDRNGGFYKTKNINGIIVQENENKVFDLQMTPVNAALEGHVKFSDGTPAVGAVLTFINANWDEISCITDENGYYKIGAIAGNMQVFTITASVDDSSYFVAYEQNEEIPITANETAVKDFTAVPYTAWITGNVKFFNDFVEQPNAGNTENAVTVKVKWDDAESGKRYVNSTNSLHNGTYRLGLTAGTVDDFSASSNMMSTGLNYTNLPTDNVNAGDTFTNIDMNITRNSNDMLKVVGTVEDESGAPVSNAYVAVFNPYVRAPETQGYTLTESDGTYRLPFLASLYDPYSSGGTWDPNYLTGVYAEGFSPDPDVNIIDDQTQPGEIVFDYTLTPIATGIDATEVTPGTFQLEQNYPNPFNAGTFLYYEIPQSGQVKLVVYNTNGQQVDTLVDGFRTKGRHTIIWHARNVASGQYIFRLTTGSYCAIRKCSLVK